MPLPPVVIELGATDAASPNASALVGACTGAVTGGECRLGADEPEARAVVIVSWDRQHRRAHVEIGTKRGGSQRWVSRDVTFREADPEPERWRAVGLVIGALVGESEREAEAQPAPLEPKARPAPPRAAPTSAVEAPSPRVEVLPKRGWLGPQASAGPALDDGSWRFGAGIVGVYDLSHTPALVSGDVRYMVRPSDDRNIDGRWLTLGLGMGLHQEPGKFRLEGKAELVADRMEASISEARSDSGGRWLAGMRLRLDGGLVLESWGVATLGVEATALSRGTVLKLEGSKVGRAPPLTWGLTAAFRFGID